MVDVAQLVELRIVVPAVVGSSPIVHPRFVRRSDVSRDTFTVVSLKNCRDLRRSYDRQLRAISSIGRAVDS